MGLRLKQVDVISPAGYVWKPSMAHFHPVFKAGTRPCLRSSRHKKAEGAALLGENADCHHQRQLAAARDKGRSCCLRQHERQWLEGLECYLQGNRREKTQRGSSTESKSSHVAIEMGPSRATRCRSLWCTLGYRQGLAECWHSVLEILLPCLLSPGFYTGCSSTQTCANWLDYSYIYAGRKQLRARTSAAVNQAAVDSGQQRWCLRSPSFSSQTVILN